MAPVGLLFSRPRARMRPTLSQNKTTPAHRTGSHRPAVEATIQAHRVKPVAEEPDYDVVTFDCYGTLIDWETGIGEAFHEALTGVERKTVSAKKLVALSDEEERRVEKEKPYKSYREVQSLAVKTIARKIDWSHPDPDILSEALPRWKPFPDTNPSLERLAKSYTLGILSNVDNDLLAATLTHFTVPFEIIITAEQVRSYKPRPAHFRAARRVIGTNQWLHVAGSLYHDIEPATKLAIPTIWVNRNKQKPVPSALRRTAKKVRNLTELANRLQC